MCPTNRRNRTRIHKIASNRRIIDDFRNSPQINNAARMEIMNSSDKINTVNSIAKAITHFAFRNGPVEGMHASPKNQLSQNDMKTLNKFMVNRLAYVFNLILSGWWAEFAFLIDSHRFYGTDWDPAKPDDGDNIKMLEKWLEEDWNIK